jgi:hypothetical protein
MHFRGTLTPLGSQNNAGAVDKHVGRRGRQQQPGPGHIGVMEVVARGLRGGCEGLLVGIGSRSLRSAFLMKFRNEDKPSPRTTKLQVEC